MNARKRAACDRCHGQKMRCVRESTCSKCNRCQASQAECIFSPARKLGRPGADRKWRLSASQPYNDVEEDQSHPTNGNKRRSSSAPYPSVLDTPYETFELSLPTPSDSLDMYSTGEEHDEQLFQYLNTKNDNMSTLSFDVIAFGDQANKGSIETPPTPLSNDAWTDLEQTLERNRKSSQTPSMLESRSNHDLLGILENNLSLLSELSSTVFTQIDACSRTPGVVATCNPAELFRKLAANVISSSAAFLDALASFENKDSPVEQSSIGFFQQEKPAMNRVLDTASILQILTIYIRITQLHQALYTQAYSMLLQEEYQTCSNSEGKQSASKNLIPLLFPQLSFGGVPLTRYPHIQVKFVLQICIHHLVEIERALGLPVEFRIGEIERCNTVLERPTGLLGQCSSRTSLLIRTIMLESEQHIHTIRCTVANLRDELQGSIEL